MQRHHRLTLLACVVLLAAPACDKDGASEQPASEATPASTEAKSSEQAKPSDETTNAATTEQSRAACPMLAEGTVVDVSDTEDGVALAFTTASADNVADLRDRVEHMAIMYEMHASHGSMMWQHMGQMGHTGHMMGEGQGHMGGGRGMQAGMGGPMPPATAKAEPIDNGARLVLTPKDPKDLDALREQVREHQRHMSAGECWSPQTEPGQA